MIAIACFMTYSEICDVSLSLLVHFLHCLGLFLQRDPQSASGFGHHLRTMHSGAVRDPAPRRCHARLLAQMRHDHQKRSRATLQILLGGQSTAETPRQLRLRRLSRMLLGVQVGFIGVRGGNWGVDLKGKGVWFVCKSFFFMWCLR